MSDEVVAAQKGVVSPTNYGNCVHSGDGIDGFVVQPNQTFVDTHGGGKKPRFDGFSMRDWNKFAASKKPLHGDTPLPILTPEEISRHNTPDDLWMVVSGVVYDCGMWQRFHPGGEAIVRACGGRDATEVYNLYHKWVSCEGMLGMFAVGRLAPSSSSAPATTSAPTL